MQPRGLWRYASYNIHRFAEVSFLASLKSGNMDTWLETANQLTISPCSRLQAIISEQSTEIFLVQWLSNAKSPRHRMASRNTDLEGLSSPSSRRLMCLSRDTLHFTQVVGVARAQSNQQKHHAASCIYAININKYIHVRINQVRNSAKLTCIIMYLLKS
jgi:hypothetical protein